MTVPRSASTSDLFRSALEFVRTYPLEPASVPPAFTAEAWLGRPPRAAAAGPVLGIAGDLWEHAQQIASGHLDPSELLEAVNERRTAFDETFHAYEYAPDPVAVPPTEGPLRGIPISVKDIIDVSEMPTKGSSAAMAPRWASADATAVGRLRAAGAVITGKAVTHEFALGVTTPQSKNPWAPERIPGGSSGGSAITVLTGMADGSLGTDTRASIRVPPALTGLVGYRPSRGVIPVDQWLTLSWTMDEFGLIARSVRDVALLADVIEGGHRLRDALPGSVDGMSFGTSSALRAGTAQPVAERFDAGVSTIERRGGRMRLLAEPSADTLLLSNMAGMIVSRVEAAQFHREQGTDLDRCSSEVREQLRGALDVPAPDYVRALRLRHMLRDRIAVAMREVDFLIMPTTKVTAPLRGEADDYLLLLSETCIPWSLIGCCAISLYAGQADGLPCGIQIVGRPGDDERLLAVAHAFESASEPAPSWTPAVVGQA